MPGGEPRQGSPAVGKRGIVIVYTVCHSASRCYCPPPPLLPAANLSQLSGLHRQLKHTVGRFQMLQWQQWQQKQQKQK